MTTLENKENKENRWQRPLVILPNDPDEQPLSATQNLNAWLKTNISCQTACPAHTDVSRYVQLVAEGNFDEAYLVNRRANVFPGVLGRVCTKPCESACRRRLHDDPVAVCSLKRSSADYQNTPLPATPPVSRAETIAIVGAGPCGLACARDLRELGYPVVVYDALPAPGGMLVGGIPAWRLPREIVYAEVDRYMYALGVEFRLNITIGKDITVETLLAEYAGVVLAAGCQKPVTLKLPGENLAGFEYGLAWLEKTNLPPVPDLDLTGKRVVVLGAGYTAIDCCRSALRLHAAEVYLCYRRSQKEAPLEEAEIAEAEKEGIKFIFLVSPLEVLGNADNQVSGLKLIRNRLGEPDKWGRRSPEAIPGSEFVISCDLVLPATGQAADFAWLPAQLQQEVQQTGKFQRDPATWQTSLPRLFAGGDFTEGTRNVISAVADGHKIAASLHAYFSHETLPAPREDFEPLNFHRRELSYLQVPRQPQPALPMSDRLSETPAAPYALKKEVELGFSRLGALQEAARCLQCMYNLTIDPNLCTLCGSCVEVCPEKVLHLVPLSDLPEWQTRYPQAAATTITLDETLCVRCGHCLAECPTQALKMGCLVQGEA